MLKRIIIFLILILSLCNLSLATAKSYTLTKDYGYLSFDGVVLTPPNTIHKTLWERDETPLSESFLNKYKNSKGESIINEEYPTRVMNCPPEVRNALLELYYKATNVENLVYFPATNAQLCPSIGDYPVESAYAKAKEFLKDFNSNYNYYLYSAVGMTTDMVNQAIEEVKKNEENEQFIKMGKISTDHLNFFKTYYQFDFVMAYEGMELWNCAPGSVLNLGIRLIVSKECVECVFLPSRVILKQEGETEKIITIEQALERLNKLEEIKANSKNEYYFKKNYFKGEVVWMLSRDEYGNYRFNGEATPLWRFGYLGNDFYLNYDDIDARTGELFIPPDTI